MFSICKKIAIGSALMSVLYGCSQPLESAKEPDEWQNKLNKQTIEAIHTDYVGEKIWLGNNLTIKLKPRQLINLTNNYLKYTTRYGTLELDKNNKKIYSIIFASKFDVTSAPTHTTIYVVPSTSKNANFDEVKQELSNVYYEDDYGFIGQHEYGIFGFYNYYDEKLKSYVIGHVMGDEKDDVIAHYISLRSIDSDKYNQNIISAEDFALSLPELETKYNLTLEGLFNKETIQKNYSDVLERYLILPDVFYNNRSMVEEDNYISVNQYLGNFSFKETKMKLHGQSLENVMTELLEKYPDGKRFNDIFVFSVAEGKRSGFVYLFETQKDTTVEIFVPQSQGHQFEKVMYGKLLESLDFSAVPQIDARIIPNIGKYTKKSFVDNGENAEFYEFEEGKTDLFGKLLTE